MATINDIISTFTESDLNLTVPLDLQDVSESDLEVVNTYNTYLSSGDYSGATTYRNEHQELEKYILDVKKYNILQAFVMNAYLYAKSQKQQCEVGATEPVGQVEGDIWYKEETTASGKNIYIPYLLTADGYVEFSIGANIVDDLNSDDADSALSAKQGKILSGKINTINTTLASFEQTKSDFVSSGLGQALGLTSSSTWSNITSAIIGVANKGSYSKTFTPTTSKQTASSGAGWYSGISLSCDPVNLSGNASNGHVLSGKTYYNTSLTKQTGTMANRSSTIQTATISTSNQSASCYRINGSNIEIIPAIGYWGSWDWAKSCIRVPTSSAIKYAFGTATPAGTTNLTYTFENDTSSTGSYEGIYYININPGFTPIFALAYTGGNDNCKITFRYVLGSNNSFIATRYSSYYKCHQIYKITSAHSFSSNSVVLPVHNLNGGESCKYIIIGY